VACVVADGDRYLMVEEEVGRRLAYNQPAGHLDDGESLLMPPCAKRWRKPAGRWQCST
jgi:hypothetical protein